MRKTILGALALLVCVSIALSVSAQTAAEEAFVPSISYKESPEVVAAVVRHEDGTVEEIASEGGITSVQDALEKSTGIAQEDREILLKKYEDIKNGEQLPFKFDYVIVQLVDVNFEPENSAQKDAAAKIEVTFDLGLEADAEVDVLKYYDGAWQAPAGVRSNGDGTVTVVYDGHFCPNAFAVKKSESSGMSSSEDEQASQLRMCGGIIGVCLIGACALTAILAKKRRAHKRREQIEEKTV